MLTSDTISAWLRAQIDDDASKRASGTSVHGNIFLQVAFAKNRIANNVRAVCPFSSATSSTLAPASDPATDVTMNAPNLEAAVAGCSAHAAPTLVSKADEVVQVEAARCPAHAAPTLVSKADEVMQVEAARCPAHAAPTLVSKADEVMQVEAARCPAHAAPTLVSEADEVVQVEAARCPAHAAPALVGKINNATLN